MIELVRAKECSAWDWKWWIEFFAAWPHHILLSLLHTDKGKYICIYTFILHCSQNPFQTTSKCVFSDPITFLNVVIVKCDLIMTRSQKMHVNAGCTGNHFALAHVEMLFALATASKVLVMYQESFHCPISFPCVNKDPPSFSPWIFCFTQKIRQYESKVDCDCLVSFQRQDEKCGRYVCLFSCFSALRTHLHL